MLGTEIKNILSHFEFSFRGFFKVIAILFLTIVCVYFTYELYIDFIEHPIAVKITEHVENEIFLPDIMICPMDPLNITKLKLDGYSSEEISAFHWHFVQDLYKQHGRSDALEFLTDFETSNVTNIVDRNDWGIFVKNYSLSCTALMFRCAFMYKTFDCCKSAQLILHEKHGVCYKFPYNSYPGDSKIDRTGADAGFVLILNVPEFNHSDIALSSLESGLLFDYAHVLTPPFTIGSFPGIRLSINSSVEISFTRSFYDRIFSHELPCINKTQKQKCRLECISAAVQNFCNCTLLGFATDQDQNKSLRVCNPADVARCFKFVPYKNYYEQHCLQLNCSLLCREWIYSPQVTYGNLNQKMWAVQAGNSSLTKDIIKVRVFYDSLRYTEIKQFNLLSLEFVLSQLGGMIGLWFGFSAFSVVKFIDRIWQWREKKRLMSLKDEPRSGRSPICVTERHLAVWCKWSSQTGI